MEEGVRLPIRNTMFVKNGAFASDIPAMADKVVRKTAHAENEEEPLIPCNASYLCSWLYKPSIDAEKIEWRDRYYFPDVMEEMDALHGKTENYIYLNDNEVPKLLKFRDEGYYDIPSKLVFERNNSYTFKRVS